MKQYVYLSLLCMIALASCTEAFKKGDDGMEYRIISSGSGKTPNYGNFIQLHISTTYKGTKDTVLNNTREAVPTIIVFDSIGVPLAYYKIIKQLKKGDSTVIRTLTDSAFKKDPAQMPKYMAKGKYIYTTITLLNIFDDVKQADSAQKAEVAVAKPRMLKKQVEMIEKEVIEKEKSQIAADSKTINVDLTKNNIKATQTKWGTFVAIQQQGAGNPITLNDIVTVNYTGRSLDSGKVFDSNVDPTFGHIQPYQVSMGNLGGQGAVILGWTDGLLQLKKGAKATIYVPSSLGYGKSGNQGIKPNANLVFDIEVLDVENEEVAMEKMKAQQEAMQKQMMDAQKKQADSLQKTAPKK